MGRLIRRLAGQASRLQDLLFPDRLSLLVLLEPPRMPELPELPEPELTELPEPPAFCAPCPWPGRPLRQVLNSSENFWYRSPRHAW